jgi:hypothetical protein
MKNDRRYTTRFLRRKRDHQSIVALDRPQKSRLLRPVTKLMSEKVPQALFPVN